MMERLASASHGGGRAVGFSYFSFLWIGGVGVDIKRCDRCGKVYGLEEGSFLLIADVEDGSQTSYACDGTPIWKKDLCEDCRVSFDKWFAGEPYR